MTEPVIINMLVYALHGTAAAIVAAAFYHRWLPRSARVYQRGYVLPEGALEQIPLGSTQEQVLIVLGTPSTVATVSGDAFYYISQRTESSRRFIPRKPTDQRVIAIYFDHEPPRSASCRLRYQRWQGFRLHEPHHAVRRRELSYIRYMMRDLRKP